MKEERGTPTSFHFPFSQVSHPTPGPHALPSSLSSPNACSEFPRQSSPTSTPCPFQFQGSVLSLQNRHPPYPCPSRSSNTLTSLNPTLFLDTGLVPSWSLHTPEREIPRVFYSKAPATLLLTLHLSCFTSSDCWVRKS